jgi:hypothetical protein
MGIPDIEAEHVTLALANAIPRPRKPRLPHPSSREIARRLLAD